VECMDDLPDALNRLVLRMEMLERRIDALEHPAALVGTPPALKAFPIRATQTVETSTSPSAVGIFSAIGMAMLGIAGAYLLRAIAESTSFSKPGIAAIAIAYAMLWLVWATRVAAGAWFAGFIYACASALILAPMLWELTLHFKVLSAPATAAVLAAYVSVAMGLVWKRNITSVLWVANVAAALVALALSSATHELLPFIAVLLLMVLLGEYAAFRNRALGLRAFVEIAADVAVLALLFVYSSAQIEHADYQSLGMTPLLIPSLVLLAMSGVSVALKTMLFRQNIAAFETVQIVVAFLLAASSLFSFGGRGGAAVLGIFCLVLSAASYAAAFVLFGDSSKGINNRVFSTWAAALFVMGCALCFYPSWLAVWLGVGSVVATVLGIRLNRLTLEFHGAAYLVAASIASGLVDYAFRSLAGNLAGAPGWSVCIVSVCACLCCAFQKPRVGERWHRKLFHLVSAGLASFALAAMLVEGLVWLLALRLNPGIHHVAFIRTLTVCVVALLLAYGGLSWGRKELTWMAYGALGLTAVKLMFEDLPHSQLGFIAASIFIFAVTLIAIPRIARTAQQRS
jgi:hypothetical protein